MANPCITPRAGTYGPRPCGKCAPCRRAAVLLESFCRIERGGKGRACTVPVALDGQPCGAEIWAAICAAAERGHEPAVARGVRVGEQACASDAIAGEIAT